jgi:hypothetical protein
MQDSRRPKHETELRADRRPFLDSRCKGLLLRNDGHGALVAK